MSNLGAYERIAFLESRMAALEARVASQSAMLDRLLKAAPDYTPETLEDGTTHRIKDIARQVAAAHGLSYTQIMGKSHAFRISHPRQRSWLLMVKDKTVKITESDILRFFDMDRSTIHKGIIAAQKREDALKKPAE